MKEKGKGAREGRRSHGLTGRELDGDTSMVMVVVVMGQGDGRVGWGGGAARGGGGGQSEVEWEGRRLTIMVIDHSNAITLNRVYELW